MAQVDRLLQLPAGIVAGTDVAHLAALHQAIQRAQRLFQRRRAVPQVNLVEIDVVGAQAA